jgi:site-specific recombinase XerC
MSETTAPHPVSFASLVQQFFTEYLVTQRALSPRTIASYRDAMLLFLDFAHKRLGKMPTALNLADIEPDLILAFLDHLEQQRHNSVRSRNLRLTALRAFLKFAARRDISLLLRHRASAGCADEAFRASYTWLSVTRRNVGGVGAAR